MYDNIDFGYLSSPCFRPEKMDGSPAFPVLYNKVMPFIKIACNETAMVGVVTPSRKMVGCIVAHMCKRIFSQYPELTKYDVKYFEDEGPDHNSNEGFEENGEFVFDGPFRDYLSTLFLLEYYDIVINI